MKPARNIQELVAWQRASELSALVERMVQGARAGRNRTFCTQIRGSSGSVAANLAEGFGKYYPRENARYVRIAKASLAETQSHLLDGKKKNYWKSAEFEQAWRLSCRAMKAIVPYLLYLEACDGEIPPPGDSGGPPSA